MKISDNGLILSTSEFQEKLLLVKIFSENHGILTAVARKPVAKQINNFNPATLVKFQKFSRLPNQLGKLTIEPIKSYYSSIIFDKIKLYTFKVISNLILSAFSEYDAHRNSYITIIEFLENLTTYKEFSWLNFCNLEISILKESGYGIDISKCVVTDEFNELCYLSPKSGKAVSKKASKGYEHLLLPLPEFLVKQYEPKIENKKNIIQALDLTEYFIKRYLWQEKNIEQELLLRSSLKKLI